MTWMGPTYGMWADTVDIINERTDALNRSNASLEKWKEHAKTLAKALEEVNEMYRGAAGGEQAQAKLKDLALAELQRLEPSNKLLDPEYRKQIGAKVRDETIAELKRK